MSCTRTGVVLAEIAPGCYNLIDGHHRVAKARREGMRSVPAHRVRCPEHVAFLTSVRPYETYVEYGTASSMRHQALPLSGADAEAFGVEGLAGEPTWSVLRGMPFATTRTAPD